jgi:hypothetical protein
MTYPLTLPRDIDKLNVIELTCCPRCAGLTLRSRFELLACCGHEAARLIADPQIGIRRWSDGSYSFSNAERPPNEIGPACEAPFTAWIKNLVERWGQHVQVRAAVAAARVAWRAEALRRARGGLQPLIEGLPEARLAIEAAETWLACPCEEHLQAWVRAYNNCGQLWVPGPLGDGKAHRESVEAARITESVEAARITDESTVRAVICASLTEWVPYV